MEIFDGKKLADEILAGVKDEVEKNGLKLKLVVVQVGENAVSQVFINQKKKACAKARIDFQLFKFPAEISSSDLKKEIEKIVENKENSGIILQLPLPRKFVPEDFLNLIPEEKDIDVLAEHSLGKFYQGTLSISPPTVNGILRLLKKYRIELKGKNVVILGTGRLVGFPLAIRLLKEKATLSVLNEFTADAVSFIKKADILVSAVGKPNLIKENMVEKGVIVIDAGSTVEQGKSVGDVDFKNVAKKASYITPVPGGVGPLTVACLLENLVTLQKYGCR